MKSLSKLSVTVAVALALSSVSLTTHATQAGQESGNAAETTQSSGSSGASQATASGQPSQTAASMSEGEIRKIDKEAGKVTIKHGPLTNLDMPAMTMNFRVKDPAMLDQVKIGDKISFVADKVNGQFTVTQVEVKN